MGATKSVKTRILNNKSQSAMTAKTSVKALFTDYDGTLSPINVSRSESAVPHETAAILQEINQQIPVAIITTKDAQFIAERTTFARAWATLGGLEIKIGSVTTAPSCIKSKRLQIEDALCLAKDIADNDLTIEVKRDSRGTPVAFSVDWRQTTNKAQAGVKADRIVAYCKTLSLDVTLYEGQPFLDVFPCPIDKGIALLSLKKKLGVHDGILYLGDSAPDNAAFEEADIAVGVLHLETPLDLTCDYFVKAEELNAFLRCLLDNAFCFDTEWPMVMNRNEAEKHLQDKKKNSIF